MNEMAIEHKCNSIYCYPVDKKTLNLRLRVSKDDEIDKIFVVYGGKYTFGKKQKEQEMSLTNITKLYNFYSISLKVNDPRICYVFKIIIGKKTYFYSEDGLSEKYDFLLNFYNAFSYAYINEIDIHKNIEWMNKAVFYQIFVDRYKNGSINKDKPYINLKEDEKPTPKSFAGGDLKGIISSLPYIKSLGVNAIYLTPIFKSISNHKYDIESYYEIDPMFGDEYDLKELIDTAHLLGIRVVLDAVFNHISERHAIFQDVIRNQKKSKFYKWFIFYNEDKFEYECFSSCKYMPKLNTNIEEVQNYLIDVGKYYVEKFNIDGWRLDVSDEVSHYFWKRFNKEIKKLNSDVILIGENRHDASDYLRGDEFDSIMNYAFLKAMLDYFKNPDFTSLDLANKLNELLMRNTDIVNKMMLNLLDSHDTLRFYTEVNTSKEKYKCAMAILFVYLGAPCIYYGDEIYLEGGYDPDSRRVMKWGKIEDDSMRNLIRNLSAFREKFYNGSIKIYSINDLFIIERINDAYKYKLLVNHGERVKIGDKNIILSSLYEENYLNKDGFVISVERII